MAVIDEFLEKEKRVEEARKKLKPYQETYADKHPWQAAALQLAQEGLQNVQNIGSQVVQKSAQIAKNTAADIGQGLQNTVSNIGATTMNMQPQYKPQTTFVEQAKPVVQKLPNPIYNAAKNTYNTVNNVTNKPINLMPSNLLSPITNRMQGIGKVLTDVYPYTKFVGGEEYGTIDNFKDFMDEAKIAYDLGVKNAIEERNAKDLNVTKLGDAALDLQILGKINPVAGSGIGANILNGATQFGTFGLLDSLKNKGVSKDLPVDTLKDAALGAVLNPVISQSLKGLGLIGAKALERVNPQNYKRVLEGVKLPNNTYDVKSKLRFKPNENIPNKDANPYFKLGENNDLTDFTMGKSGPLRYGLQRPGNTVNNAVSNEIKSTITQNRPVALGIKEIAPNIAAKQEAQKQAVKENLTTENTVIEQTSDTFKSYKDAFKELKQKGKGYTIVENPDKTYSVKEVAKASEKVTGKVPEQTEVEKKIEELAPNIAKKQEQKVVTGLDENGNSAKFDVTDITNVKKVEAADTNFDKYNTENLQDTEKRTEVQPTEQTLTLKELKSNIAKNKFPNYQLQRETFSKGNLLNSKYYTKVYDNFENEVTKATRDFNEIIKEIYKNPEKVADEKYISDLEERVSHIIPGEEYLPGLETEAYNKLYDAIKNADLYNQAKQGRQAKNKKANPDIAKIAPKTVAKQQGKNLEIEDFENLNIQNATVKTKAGKEKVIEYVNEVPKGWVKNDGATTAPLGYKWYTNGKSLIKGERKNILVKEKAATEEVSEVQPKAEEKTAQKSEIGGINVEELARERAELLNQDFIKNQRKYIEEQRKKGWDSSADNLERELEEYIKSGKNQYLGQFNIDFANAIKNKDYNTVLSLLAQGKGSNEVSKKLFEKYTGVKLPSTIEGKKNAILEWAGKDIDEYNAEIKEAYAKKQAEREKEAKERELNYAIDELKNERIRTEGWGVITKQEFIKNLIDSGYTLEKKKQGIKPVYSLWKDKFGYSFKTRNERLYIDELFSQKEPAQVSEQDNPKNSGYYNTISYEIMPSGQVRKIEYGDTPYDAWGNGNARHTFLTKEEYEQETGKKYEDLKKSQVSESKETISKKSTEKQEKSTEKYEDYGEKIEGAKKDLAGKIEKENLSNIDKILKKVKPSQKEQITEFLKQQSPEFIEKVAKLNLPIRTYLGKNLKPGIEIIDKKYVTNDNYYQGLVYKTNKSGDNWVQAKDVFETEYYFRKPDSYLSKLDDEHIDIYNEGKTKLEFQYSTSTAGGYYLWAKKGRGSWKPILTFKDKAEMLEHKNNSTEEDLKNIFEENTTYQSKELPVRDRKGIDYRNGKDVSTKDFAETFGFRGVQFGNYEKNDKRISEINNAYDSLLDLAHILNIPEKAISLNGSLGIAFGARGSGSAAAHYEPKLKVINITRDSGAGSLAHEWLHALDNYLSQSGDELKFITKDDSNLRKELAEKLHAYQRAVAKEKDFQKRLRNLGAYWKRKEEIAARIFSQYIYDKVEKQGYINDYLSQDRTGELPFLTKEEKERIFPYLDDFFNTLKTRETEKGVELYDENLDIPVVSEIIGVIKDKKRELELIKQIKADRELKIAEGQTIKEIKNDNNIISQILDFLNTNEFDDYTIASMPESERTLTSLGYHIGKSKAIFINMDAIKAAPTYIDQLYQLVNTIVHELNHAKQEIAFNKLCGLKNISKSDIERYEKYWEEFYSSKRNDKKLKKQFSKLNAIKYNRNLSKDEVELLYNYTEATVVNRARKKFYNSTSYENGEKISHKELIDNYNSMLRMNSQGKISDVEFENYFNGLSNKERGIIIEYGRLYNNYVQANNEVSSREVGEETAKEYINRGNRPVISGVQKSNVPLNNNRGVRAIPQYGSTQGPQGTQPTYSERREEPTKRQQEIIDKVNSNKSIKQANETAKNYVREWYAGIEKDRYDVNRSLNSLINLTKQKAKDFSKSGLKISDKQIREIMPFLRERTEFPDKLDRPDLKKVWGKLSKSQKAELTKLADSVSEKFEKYYKNYQDSRGVVTENEIENHISHIWDLDKKKTSLLTNYFVTQSKFAKERTIDTLYKGIQGLDVGNGEIVHFTPKTLDYAEILKASSDNLIKATHDMQLANIVKKLKDGKTSLVQSMSKAPADWVEVNHPALNKAIYMGTVGEEETPMIMKTPVKVHPEIARTIQTVFETPATKNDFITGYDKLNSIFKQSQLGFSGFHMVALSESMLGNMGIKETVKILNPKRIWDEVVKGNWNIYKDDTIAKQAIDDGLQFGATLDLDRNGVEKIADDVSNWVEKRIPVIGKTLSFIPKTLSKAQKLNNSVLWDYLHNNYKFECYKILCQQAAKNGPISTKERQEIAQWVNDSFGGQVWENLGIKPSGRRTEQRFLLSPDWLRSTTRQFMGMFSNKGLAEKISKKAEESAFWKNAKELGERWGINSNTDDVTASNLRGKIARRFWVRSIIYSAILYNALNAVMRGYDREKHPELYPEKMTIKDYTLLGNSKGNKTYVFVGRNKDGSERYLRLGKQFREVPEMLEDPLKKLGGKASPNIQLISQLATGHTASGFQNRDMYVDKYPYNQMREGKDRLKASGKVIAKSFMPYSLNTLFNPDADWTPLSLFAPVSKGMTKGKGRRAYEENIYNDKNAREITQAMIRNNIPKDEIDKAYKQARTNVRTAYKNMYIEAIETGNEQKVIEVTHKLKKKGLSNDEINYIYNKALEKIEE